MQSLHPGLKYVIKKLEKFETLKNPHTHYKILFPIIFAAVTNDDDAYNLLNTRFGRTPNLSICKVENYYHIRGMMEVFTAFIHIKNEKDQKLFEHLQERVLSRFGG